MAASSIVEIKTSANGGGAPDWAIVELQGTVDARDAATPLDGLTLGTLTFNSAVRETNRLWRRARAQMQRANAQGDPVLTIGTSMLVGKVVKLAKPLVVISSDEPAGDGVAEQRAKRARLVGDASDDESWNVVGIVRKKLLFKSRPQPIVQKA